VRALCDYVTAAVDDVRTQLRDPTRSAYDRLTRHLRNQAKAVAADTSRRGCMMAKTAAELGATDDAVQRTIEQAYTIWRGELVDCIKQAQLDGAIDGTANTQALATTLLAFMRGLGALHQGGAKPAQIKSAADEMIAVIPKG
jgi:TetR/AcrR family transcriptional regulator, transcriptional repressor for nem operon